MSWRYPVVAAAILAGALTLAPSEAAAAKPCHWSACNTSCLATERFTGLRETATDGTCTKKWCCPMSVDELAAKCRGKCGNEPNAYGGYFQCMAKCKKRYGIGD